MINWTEPQPPNENIRYDHVTCDTPLGFCSIEWKSWKKYDVYDITIGNEDAGYGDTLDDAKQKAYDYLADKRQQLNIFLDGK